MSGIPRTRRIGEQLKQELSQLIRKEVRDNRALMVSITLINVVRDLSQAKVYFTYLGPETERDEVTALLNDHSGVMQRMLGKILKLRKIPKFEFIYDEQLEKSNKLSALISEAIRDDEEKAQLK